MVSVKKRERGERGERGEREREQRPFFFQQTAKRIPKGRSQDDIFGTFWDIKNGQKPTAQTVPRSHGTSISPGLLTFIHMPWLNRGRFLAFSHVLTAGMSSSESALGSDFLRTWDHLRLTKTAAWMQVIIGLQENSDQSLVLIHPWSRRYARSGSPSAGAAGQGRDGLGHLVWKRMTAQCRWNGLLAMTCKDLQGAFFLPLWRLPFGGRFNEYI